MVLPVLQTGERWLIRSRDVSVKGTLFQAYLTNRRVILQSPRDSSVKTRDLALDRVAGIAPSVDRTGEPELVISARSSSGEYRRLVIVFPLQPSCPPRANERNAWYRTLAGVLGTPAAGIPGNPVAEERMIGPAVRAYRCPSCGRQVPPRSKYCDRCGVRVIPLDRGMPSSGYGSAGTAAFPEAAGRPGHGISKDASRGRHTVVPCRPVQPRPVGTSQRTKEGGSYSPGGKDIRVWPEGNGSSWTLRNHYSFQLHRLMFPATAAALVGCIVAGICMLVSPVGVARVAGAVFQAIFFFR